MRFEAHREKGFSFAFNVPRPPGHPWIHGMASKSKSMVRATAGEVESKCTAYVCIIDIQGRNAEKAQG